MKMSTIERALCALQASEGCTEEDRADLIDCWQQIMHIKNDRDGYSDDLYLVSYTQMDAIGNELWYDSFGRVARKVGYDNVKIEDVVAEITQESLTGSLYPLVYDNIFQYFVNDLWQSNDQCDANKPDGSYCKIGLKKYHMLMDLIDDKIHEVGFNNEYVQQLIGLKRDLRQII